MLNSITSCLLTACTASQQLSESLEEEDAELSIEWWYHLITNTSSQGPNVFSG